MSFTLIVIRRLVIFEQPTPTRQHKVQHANNQQAQDNNLVLQANNHPMNDNISVQHANNQPEHDKMTQQVNPLTVCWLVVLCCCCLGPAGCWRDASSCLALVSCWLVAPCVVLQGFVVDDNMRVQCKNNQPMNDNKSEQHANNQPVLDKLTQQTNNQPPRYIKRAQQANEVISLLYPPVIL
jgi:hypothetical protein